MLEIVLPLVRLVAVFFTLGAVTALPVPATLALGAGLGVPLALLVAPLAPPPEAGAVLAEIVLGSALGLLASIPLVAARIGGALFDQRLSGPSQAIMGIAAGVVLFGAGLDRDLVRALGESFVRIPPGQAKDALDVLASAPQEALRWALRFGVRVGWPMLAAALGADLVGAFLSRLAPHPGLGDLPRQSAGLLGLLAGLGAISYALKEAAEVALRAILSL